MAGSKRFIVLEILDHVDVLKECVEFLALTSPDTGLKVINHREASSILYFLACDTVDAELAHKLYNPENVENILSILYGVPRNALVKGHHDAYQVIRTHSLWQGVEFNLHKQIGEYIEHDSWTDWKVVKSAGLVGLVEGEDHRIVEFHKPEKALDVENEDEAAVTINCSNPINYLYNQFMIRYGYNLKVAQDHLNRPDVVMDQFYRKMISDFLADPTEQIAAMFCEGMSRVNPQIEVSINAPKINRALFKILNIYDDETFYREIVSKLIMAFGMGHLGYAVKKDESYTLEFYTGTNIMAVYRKRFSTITEKYEEELLHAFNRGDFLPYEERKIAERLYTERANMVLNLRQ